MRWERRKRQLDRDMHAACMQLDSLPSHIPLPPEFLSHLNALLSTELDINALKVPTALGVHIARDTELCRSSVLLQRFCSRARVQKLPQTTSGNYSLQPNDLQLKTPMHEGYSAGSRSMSMSMSSSNSTSETCGQKSQVRFLGQFPEDIGLADRALRELQVVQRLELELCADVVGLKIPGVCLAAEQCMAIWTGLMSHSPVPDCLELCQVAATQRNRGSLFTEPFPGAMASGCFRHVLSHDVLSQGALREGGGGNCAHVSGAAAMRAPVYSGSAV